MTTKVTRNKMLWRLPVSACTSAFSAAAAQQESGSVGNSVFEIPGDPDDATWLAGAPVAGKERKSTNDENIKTRKNRT
jgi:hypothetical protein